MARRMNKLYYSTRETETHYEMHVGTKAECLAFQSLSKRWRKEHPDVTKAGVVEIVKGDVKEFSLLKVVDQL